MIITNVAKRLFKYVPYSVLYYFVNFLQSTWIRTQKFFQTKILNLEVTSLRLRLYLFCEGRISVLKRRFKTPFTRVLFMLPSRRRRFREHALRMRSLRLPKKECQVARAISRNFEFRLLFELKWTGKAFIWRHLNVVICEFAFMLPPESAFCSNHDRKRTFLGCV